jgi:lysophospholipase L1-like esterase
VVLCALAGALTLLVAACGGGDGLEPLPPGGVILAFGDSLTYGSGAREGESYPEVLAALTGHPVVRAGVPGEVTAQGLRRLPGVLERERPALVILCHGGNDILRKGPLDGAADNLRQMVRLARAAGAQVVLLGVPRFGLFLEAADFYAEVAAAEGVPLEEDALPEILADNGLKADPVHPNAAGYARLARAVDAFLRDQGAL